MMCLFYVSFFWFTFQVMALVPRSRCGLAARQLEALDPSILPAQCETHCSSIVETINTSCASTTCPCTTNTQNHLVECLNCVVSLAPGVSEVYTQAQASLDGLEENCRGAGRTLPRRMIRNLQPTQITGLESPQRRRRWYHGLLVTPHHER